MKNKTLSGVVLLFAMLGVGAVSCGNDVEDEPIGYEYLPHNAQTFLSSFFNSMRIKNISMDVEHSNSTYEVEFVNGYEIEFDRAGNWTDIDAPDGWSIPDGIAPARIADYIDDVFLSTGINEISRDYKGYEVKLVTGTELEFDINGYLIDIDD